MLLVVVKYVLLVMFVLMLVGVICGDGEVLIVAITALCTHLIAVLKDITSVYQRQSLSLPCSTLLSAYL